MSLESPDDAVVPATEVIVAPERAIAFAEQAEKLRGDIQRVASIFDKTLAFVAEKARALAADPTNAALRSEFEKGKGLAAQADALLAKLNSDFKDSLGALGPAVPVDEPAPLDQGGKGQIEEFDFGKLSSIDGLHPRLADAIGAIGKRDRASPVVLQRALGVGYKEATDILDQLTKVGVLGPDAPGGARQMNFTGEQWERHLRTL